ncbi:MAG TPA: hypothetical protein VFZ04_04100, partial [Longimicrobiales bacterium]
NAERCGLVERVEFRSGEVWRPVGDAEVFDIVIANPPYIAPEERPGLQPEVRDWEPATALFAPAAGLAVIREIIQGAAAHLRSGGLLALEVAATHAQQVADEIDSSNFDDVKVIRDLAGRDRVVTAVRKADV